MTTLEQPAGPRPGTAAVDGRLRSRRLLLGVTAAASAAEAAVLQLLHLHSSVGLAPQVVAPPPYSVFHDLRWLLVYHRSLAGFAVEAALVWAARSALSAVLVRAAWADPATRPDFLTAWRRSAAFTLVCAVLLTPFAALMFGAAVASVSWLVLAAVPSVLSIAVLAGHGSAARRWYASGPSARVAGWMALAFAGYTLAAAALTVAPGPVVVPLAALAGLFDAWAWRGVVTGVVIAEWPARQRHRRGRPVSVVGLVAFAAVLLTGTAIGFHLTRIDVALHPPPAPAYAGGQPVLVVSGFGTPWSGAPPERLGPGFAEWRFSYAGTTPHGRPRPYSGQQTYAPLPVLARRMAEQVAAVHRLTGRPVSIVAESEGALVTEAYLHATPDPPVGRVAVLSPLVQPGRVYYPPSWGDGYGVAAGWELRGLSATLETLGSEAISGDNPFLRSVADHGPQLRRLLTCPVPGVDQLAVLPLADATSTPYGSTLAVRSIVVPGFHGGLLGEPHVRRIVARYLGTGVAATSPVLRLTNAAIRAGAAAWQVPELAVTDNPAWSGLAVPGCAADDGGLRNWIYGGTPPPAADAGPAGPAERPPRRVH